MGFFKLPRKLKDRAYTFAEWREEEKWQRENFPLRYFLWETLPDWLAIRKRILIDFYYIIRSWFFPYNRIKISTLPRTYQDPLDVLLHGAFQVLVDYVEKERIPFIRAWSGDPTLSARDAFRTTLEEYLEEYDTPPEEEEKKLLAAQVAWEKEVLDLYLWWTEARPLREKEVEESIDKIDSLDVLDLPLNDPRKRAWLEYCEASWKREEADNQEDEDMLVRLAKVRLHLWE